MLKKRLIAVALAIVMLLTFTPLLVSAEPWGNISWLFDSKTGVLTLTGTGKDSPSGTIPWKSYKNSITELRVEDGVTSLGSNWFDGYGSLEKVTLPDSLRKFGGGNGGFSSTFKDCISLKEITLPKNLTEIGHSAFEGCSNLTTITIPAKVSKIGGKAFYGCSKLTTVIFTGDAPEFDCTYPKGNPNNKSYAFENTDKLTIYYPNNAKGWDIISLPFGKVNWVSYDPAKGISGTADEKTATSTVKIDGKSTTFETYNVGGDDYFNIHDIMKSLDINIKYDEKTKTYTIDTSKGYND